MADLADNNAATTAGYRLVQADRGPSANPRYMSRYEKWLVGSNTESGHLHKAEAWSNTSQAAADALALADLNLQREFRTRKPPASGGSHTVDLH